MIDDQIMLHKKSQEKGFPHEKSNLELNYKILETRRSKYLKDKQKVSTVFESFLYWNFLPNQRNSSLAEKIMVQSIKECVNTVERL